MLSPKILCNVGGLRMNRGNTHRLSVTSEKEGKAGLTAGV